MKKQVESTVESIRDRAILILSVNRDYMNPTTRLMLSIFQNIGRVYVFGPGFSSEEELEAGPEEYIDNVDIDWIVCDSFVYEWEAIVKRENPFEWSCIDFCPELYRKYVQKIHMFFVGCSLPRMIFGNSDPHVISREVIETIVDKQIRVIFWGKEFIGDPKELHPTMGEAFKEVKSCYADFVGKYPELVISAPHCVSELEVNYSPLKPRPIEISVPGTGYAERKVAEKQLGLKYGINWWMQKSRRAAFTGLAATNRSHASRIQMFLFREGYRKLLARSKRAFVSGSYLRYAVRKYFEIPAAGTAMYCEECLGLNGLGFIDQENCHVVSGPSELRDRMESSRDIDKLAELARRGRELILRKHSVQPRAEQIGKCLDAIEEGSYSGSRWHHGKFQISKWIDKTEVSKTQVN
jgi:hypothetical protein